MPPRTFSGFPAARKFPIGEGLNLEVIADGFNVLSRFNVSDVSLPPALVLRECRLVHDEHTL
jgi:hypothetical protein